MSINLFEKDHRILDGALPLRGFGTALIVEEGEEVESPPILVFDATSRPDVQDLERTLTVGHEEGEFWMLPGIAINRAAPGDTKLIIEVVFEEPVACAFKLAIPYLRCQSIIKSYLTVGLLPITFATPVPGTTAAPLALALNPQVKEGLQRIINVADQSLADGQRN